MPACPCPEIPYHLLGETVGFWIQTLALLGSATAAVWLILDARRGVERQIKANHEAVERQIEANRLALAAQIKTSQEGVEKQILAASRGEERRATIELLLSQNGDPALKAAKSVIKGLHESGTQNFATFLNDRKSSEYQYIMQILNTYEFMAAAIREEALDEELLKRMQYTVILKNWNALEPFVIELRRQDKHPTLFQELQLMVARWQASPLKKET
jgi:hypothetical protein